MSIKKYTLLALLVTCFSFSGIAQDFVTWGYSSKKVSDNEVELTFSARIDSQYHMYTIDRVEDGPLPLEFVFEPSASYELVGDITTSSPVKVEFDEQFEKDLAYYEESVVLTQRIKVLVTEPFTLVGNLSYQICGEGSCIPGDADFSFNISGNLLPQQAGAANNATEQAAVAAADTAPAGDTENESFFGFILAAIAAGLACIVTPCVFPMIPMTVGFFMSGSRNRRETVGKAVAFWLSVGLVYGIVGVIIAIFKSDSFAEVISTHWVPNLLFAVLFIIFAASFFGMFEITLPTGLANKADKQVDKGGYLASFFMAIVLAIVSFSCTGPFVGSLIYEASQGTAIVKPILGFVCFGLALAAPFLIFAIFPRLMEKLPKSGGWLNSVKVVFAFIMLAFSVKFLVQVESFFGWDIISREVAIGFWIALAILMGVYLLGKIKFSHDSPVAYVSFFRLLLASFAFTFAIYLVPGLFGSDLDAVSAFLPSKDKQSFDITQLQGTAVTAGSSSTELAPCGNSAPKYAGADTRMSLPHGIVGYYDLQEALACAKEQNKPLLVEFTGIFCTNCKKMKATTFKDPRVIELINKEFVFAALYTDAKDVALPEAEKTTSKKGKPINTLGELNAEYQLQKFNVRAYPYFAVMDASENIVEKGLGYADADELLDFLNNALAKHKN